MEREQDEWRERDGGLRCSYCGSQHPDEFMEHLESGGKVEPTDKSYKVYVRGRAFAKFYFQHLSEPQRERVIALYNQRVFTITGGDFYVLPFFMRRGQPKTLATKETP